MSEDRPPDPHQRPTRRHQSIDPRETGEKRPASERIPGIQDKTRRSKRVSDQGQAPRKPQPVAQTPPPENGDPEDSGLYVPWWGFVLVILGVAAITCGMWYMVLANREDVSTSTGPTPTPIFVVITATPTLGSAENETQPTATPTPPEATNTPPPTVSTTIEVDVVVEITGTEGDGLAVRQGPGVDYTYFFVGDDGEQFVVEDGPREADGYVWWYIVDPADDDRSGWAAQDWLKVSQ